MGSMTKETERRERVDKVLRDAMDQGRGETVDFCSTPAEHKRAKAWLRLVSRRNTVEQDESGRSRTSKARPSTTGGRVVADG